MIIRTIMFGIVASLALTGTAFAQGQKPRTAQASTCPHPPSFFTASACQARSRVNFPGVDPVKWCSENNNSRGKYPGCS